MSKTCELCGRKREFIYYLNDDAIEQCQSCKTVCTANMPDNKTLQKYYSGFKYCIDEGNKKLILNDRFNKWFKSFNLPQNAKMLDIGGGNGYFSLAFEQFGYGKATYIDLDSEACEYVKTLNITKVINDDVKNLAKYSQEKFDFIYSRHVIEHLTKPTLLIDAAIECLSDDGVFVLQMPNGLSFERNVDNLNYSYRAKLLKKSNNFSDKETNKILHSDKIAFGLEPPRHLWAFSAKGISEYLSKRNDITFEIKTYSSRDRVYSPYMGQDYYSRYVFKKVFLPLKNFLRFLYSIPNGRAHLVAIIRKQKV